MNFASDNTSGVCPEVFAALGAANHAHAAYGEDDVSARLDERFGVLFEEEVRVFPVASGTAANALALAALTPPYGGILCHERAHVVEDECGAPEFMAGAARLVPVTGDHGRIDPGALRERLDRPDHGVHATPLTTLTVTQATEAGTVYGLAELRRLVEVADDAGLSVHVDGARFANAIVALDVSPAALTSHLGVRALSFGATKNGAMDVDAVVLFAPPASIVRDFAYRRKRSGHLLSKLWFLAAQLEAYLADDLWLRNARHANALAARLADGLARLSVADLVHPVDANEVFVAVPDHVVEAMRAAGATFHAVPGPESSEVRLVTSWATTADEVDQLLDVVAGAG